MSRGLSSAQVTASKASHSTCTQLVKMAFPSGSIRGSVCGHDITTSDGSYPAINALRNIDAMSEATDSTEGLKVVVDGLNAGIITILAQEQYKGSLLTLYEVWFENIAGAYVAIDDPVVQWVGRITSISSDESNGVATVVVQAEHYEAELRRAKPTYYNDSTQRRLYPTDKGGEHVERMTEVTLVWPSKEALRINS